MSKRHGAREQKRLAKQKAKRDARRKQLARINSPDPTVRLRDADRWPIVASLTPKDLWTEGIGQCIFARRMPDGQVACAVFLVDVFCLGVKDGFWRVMTRPEFDELVDRIGECGRLQSVTPEYFSKLVHCAADYAQSIGLPPHRDFRHWRLLLAGIDPSQCADEFTFGRDGKPFYIRGPYESLATARAISKRVVDHGGNYVVQFTDAEASDELDVRLADDEYSAEATGDFDDEELDDDDALDVESRAAESDPREENLDEDDHDDKPGGRRRWWQLPWM